MPARTPAGQPAGERAEEERAEGGGNARAGRRDEERERRECPHGRKGQSPRPMGQRRAERREAKGPRKPKRERRQRGTGRADERGKGCQMRAGRPRVRQDDLRQGPSIRDGLGEGGGEGGGCRGVQRGGHGVQPAHWHGPKRTGRGEVVQRTPGQKQVTGVAGWSAGGRFGLVGLMTGCRLSRLKGFRHAYRIVRVA